MQLIQTSNSIRPKLHTLLQIDSQFIVTARILLIQLHEISLLVGQIQLVY